jgi:eukaryotic-like serine/threonine-protein kinase
MEGPRPPPVTLESGTSSYDNSTSATQLEPSTPSCRSNTNETWERGVALEREELLANVTRLRRAGTIGMFMWPCFGALDYLIALYVRPGILPWLLMLRMFGWAFLALVVLGLRRRPPTTARGLLAYDCCMFSVAAALISLMCVGFDGFRSPYAGGVCLVLVARAAFVEMPWRRALLPTGLTAAMYPLVLLGSTALVGKVDSLLYDRVALVFFTVYLAFILGTAAFSVLGGHSAWALRRQLFEARGIGRYRLVKRIGQGGMSEVWSALHPSLRRHVAMKILQPRRRTDPVALRRFEREVRATSELSHPNTVRIFDYGVTPDGLWYYTMELLSGLDLSRLVARDGPLSVARAVLLVGQAARALGEAHARGIVHRDVKPENIFITSRAEEPEFVKVLDFGIAKLIGEEGEEGLTAEGWIGGTPAYMSPEAAAGHEADARSDVYALSAVLYFALSGHPPFDGPNVQTLLAAHLRQRPEPPSVKLGLPLPEQLEAFILENLSKDPGARCESAGEFATRLAALCACWAREQAN